MKVPYYPGDIYNSICSGSVELENWGTAQIHTRPGIREILKKIAEASKAKDHKLKQELKCKLYYITPAVHIERGDPRRYSSIKYFTGYMQLDFDKLTSIQEAMELRDYIFDTYECIVMSYLSPSRLGVKCILQIPRCTDVEEYKDYHAAVEEEMSQQSEGFDHATFNCVLPLFISHDPDLQFRKNPTVWTVKKDRTVDYVHLNAKESEWGRGMTDAAKSLHTIAQFKNKINEIVDSDGHPRLRSACLVLGSRAGAGYMDIQQATELAHYMIDQNGYLRKKLSTYLKSADWALNQGYNTPAYY